MRDDPDEADQDPADNYDEVEEIPCPYCGKPVYEQAELCPHCESYISDEDAQRRRVGKWFWLGVIFVLGAVVTWVLFNHH